MEQLRRSPWRAVVVLLSFFVSAPATAKDTLKVGVSWAGIQACIGSAPSPAFTVEGVPKRTRRLDFALTDQFGGAQGGSWISYKGSEKIMPGTFRIFAPCPRSSGTLLRWTVNALDAENKVLASGSIMSEFPFP
jgi:hypothetical protein